MQPDGNPYFKRFEVAASPWISMANLSGSSSTQWYLLWAPDDFAIMEVAFLNGKKVPTIETSETDFNTLGVQMRGYWDFGVAMREKRGGVKSRCAA